MPNNGSWPREMVSEALTALQALGWVEMPGELFYNPATGDYQYLWEYLWDWFGDPAQYAKPSRAAAATNGQAQPITATPSLSLAGLAPVTQSLAQQFLAYVAQHGVQYKVTSTKRTWWEQFKLWLDWQAGRNPYPAARPGSSDHELGRAFDVCFFSQGTRLSYQDLSQAGLGPLADYFWLRWGGRTDPIHFALACDPLFAQGVALPECLEPVLEV